MHKHPNPLQTLTKCCVSNLIKSLRNSSLRLHVFYCWPICFPLKFLAMSLCKTDMLKSMLLLLLLLPSCPSCSSCSSCSSSLHPFCRRPILYRCTLSSRLEHAAFKKPATVPLAKVAKVLHHLPA